EVRLDQPIQAQVAVDLIGEAIGSKEGGVLSQVTREITVQALPLEMPDRVELDVSGMAIGDTPRISDLAARRDGVASPDEPQTGLASVPMPSRCVEPEPEEGEEPAEGEEAAEAAEGAAEAPAKGEEAPAGESESAEE